MRFDFWRQKRRRHPCDKGHPHQAMVGAGFRILLTKSYWKRHAAPFSKTRKGRDRREERLFVKRHLHDELKTVADNGLDEHNRAREDYWRIREERQLITNMMRKNGWL